jgi:F-type H+-transporting ATPase subunit a
MLTSLQFDTVIGTACAGLVLVGAATWMRVHATVDRPSTLQVLGEATIEAADRSVGARPRWIRDRVVALAITLFWFIVIANWLHLVPGVQLPAPTADLNLTLALALIVIGAGTSPRSSRGGSADTFGTT